MVESYMSGLLVPMISSHESRVDVPTLPSQSNHSLGNCQSSHSAHAEQGGGLVFICCEERSRRYLNLVSCCRVNGSRALKCRDVYHRGPMGRSRGQSVRSNTKSKLCLITLARGASSASEFGIKDNKLNYIVTT
eukprot:4899439-Amphidinium_carterae.1